MTFAALAIEGPTGEEQPVCEHQILVKRFNRKLRPCSVDSWLVKVSFDVVLLYPLRELLRLGDAVYCKLAYLSNYSISAITINSPMSATKDTLQYQEPGTECASFLKEDAQNQALELQSLCAIRKPQRREPTPATLRLLLTMHPLLSRTYQRFQCMGGRTITGGLLTQSYGSLR